MPLDMPAAQADRLARAIRAAELYDPDLEPSGDPDAVARAEADLGRRLPADMAAWFDRYGRGAYLVDGALVLDPLHSDDVDEERFSSAVVSGADELRGYEWVIPEEVVVFGSNGGGEVFGIWLPGEPARRAPVLLLGVGDEEGPDLTVLAADFTSFLTGQLARGDVGLDPRGAELEDEMLDLLEVPRDLRDLDGGDDEDAEDRVLRWASPDVPEVRSDLYGDPPFTLEDVRRIASRP